MAKSFIWLTPGKSGYWANPANWSDLTDATSGFFAPAAGDTVTIGGGSGIDFQIVGGPGVAAALSAYGNNAIEGMITTVTLTIGEAARIAGFADGNGDALDVEANAIIAATGNATVYSNLEVDGPGAELRAGGTFAVLDGHFDTPTGAVTSEIVVVNGAVLSAADIAITGTLVESRSGTVEAGFAGGAAQGVLTVDRGATLMVGSLAIIGPAVTDNGDAIIASGGTSTFDGGIAGTGTLETTGNAVASIDGAVTGLSSLTLAGGSRLTVVGQPIGGVGPIALGAKAQLTAGALANDGPIDVGGGASLNVGPVTGGGVITAEQGATIGLTGGISGNAGLRMGVNSVLNLTGNDVGVPIDLGTGNGVAVNLVAGAVISGAVTGFDKTDLIRNAPSTTTTDIINRAVWTPGTLTLSSGTTVIDTVSLAGSYAGLTFLTNAVGITYGDSDVTLPGALVAGIGAGTQTITGSAGRSYTLITGGGGGGALTFKANVALAGAYTASTLHVVSSAAGTTDALDLQAGATLSVSGDATIATNLELTDTGAALAVGGTLTLGGDPSYSPELLMLGGTNLRSASLTISGPSGQFASGSATPVLSVLGIARAELGSQNLAGDGQLAIDPGATLTLAIANGTISTASGIIDDGTITEAASAQGLSQTIIDGPISGTGVVQALGSLSVIGDVTGVAVAVAGDMTVDSTLSGVSALTIGAGAQLTVDKNLSVALPLEVGAGGKLTVNGMTDSLTSLTVDAGASANFLGITTGVGPVVVGDNGALDFDGASGHGAIGLGNAVTFTVIGTLTDWSGVTLGGSDVLKVFSGADFAVPVSGFDTSDVIDYSATDGSIVTGAVWAPGSGGAGTLTLTDDGVAVQSYTLTGALEPSYASQTFVTFAGFTVNAGPVATSVVSLAFASQAGLTGTSFTGSTGGSFALLTGTGTAPAYTLLGNVAVTGGFALGAATFGTSGLDTTNTNAVLIEQGASVSASTALVRDITEVDGPGAVLNVAGTLSMFSYDTNILMAVNGGLVQAGGLQTTASYAFDTSYMNVDPAGAIEIGRVGGAVKGAVTIDAGATLSTASQLDIYTTSAGVVLNGTWDAQGPAGGFYSSSVYGGSIQGTGVLQVGANATVSVLYSVIGLSSIVLNGGSLGVYDNVTAVARIAVGAGDGLSVGEGVVGGYLTTGSVTLADATSATTAGGTLSVQGTASGTGTLSLGYRSFATFAGTLSGFSAVTVGVNARLNVLGGESASPIAMQTGSALGIALGEAVTGTISGFALHDQIDVTDAVHGTIVTGATWAAGAGGLGTLTLTSDATSVATLTLAGDYSGYQFLTNFAGEPNETVITLADPPCFAEGTQILTPAGEIAVERLRVGDLVCVSGGVRPVRWLGSRAIAVATHPDPERVAPVRISAGAIADGVPVRDLVVSPDHALLLDGRLVPARLLRNGVSVTQDLGVDRVRYLHVEIDGHDILFADGAPAESYLDTGNRWAFTGIGPLDARERLRTRAHGACLDLCTDPVHTKPLWRAIAARAGIDDCPPTQPDDSAAGVETVLVMDGAVIRPISRAPNLVFALPSGASRLTLRSASHRPSDASPWLDDRRRLGVPVRRVAVDDVVLPLDGPAFAGGWWAPEAARAAAPSAALLRWTNGTAQIRVPEGARLLTVTIAP